MALGPITLEWLFLLSTEVWWGNPVQLNFHVFCLSKGNREITELNHWAQCLVIFQQAAQDSGHQSQQRIVSFPLLAASLIHSHCYGSGNIPKSPEASAESHCPVDQENTVDSPWFFLWRSKLPLISALDFMAAGHIPEERSTKESGWVIFILEEDGGVRKTFNRWIRV